MSARRNGLNPESTIVNVPGTLVTTVSNYSIYLIFDVNLSHSLEFISSFLSSIANSLSIISAGHNFHISKIALSSIKPKSPGWDRPEGGGARKLGDGSK